ncbi:beta-aspartyl-dipeptidase (metallo-type) [Fervidobacterium changbaicum]|uniref:Isoaspartyl dipeptidase n=3 Tax=Fervidobacterium TaxID=2422 RepID=A0AAI8CML9_FERIS|nr:MULTISPECIES: beta-aspartyl-peptidase [Fervidobacterium]AMW33200.1 beta-aspartyl-peptidase [Fervidobacterium islandicum]QAV33262.1 beta-aspartyl-peptidase [Fervidobacterium changbaicum]7CDH_X Chain X, Isoaspartyl dipeptidase [Fervidobacterium islandicum]SDH06412.1 beta-aspartyl-dipeptidase (metallo-type) [Fervidobacterium changbaicum]
MIKIIKNAKVFSPEYIGKKDVIFYHKVIHVGEGVNTSVLPFEHEIYDANGLLLLPGLIDPHVHITGGGGEGGFETRTPELKISDCIRSGVTTVVGCLGTDGITRSLENLYAKAKSLESEGLNTFIYTGSYRVPPVTFTGSIMRDIVLIDKVIGVGEIAISDHRSSQPTLEEILRIVADIRVGGMISGKAGIVNFHVGSGKRGIEYLFDIIEKTEIPIQHLYPTHMSRSRKLFEQGLEFAKRGGTIDLTALQPKDAEFVRAEFTTIDAICEAYENGLLDNVTISSDGQGSLPKFDDNGNFVGLDVGSVSAVWYTIRKVLEKGLPLAEVLKISTTNPARVFKLNKGKIAKGQDADFILVDEQSFEIVSVISKGEFLMKDGVMKNLNFEF